MHLFLYLVALTLILGVLMPQRGRSRIYYIVLMSAIFMFVCAFRYNHLTGDLKKYHAEFLNLASYGWLSDAVLQEGRNTGFYLLNKLVYTLSGGDFQMLLIVIAFITYSILGYVIYRYSPAPWMSFLIWSCIGLFIFGLSAIKQSLAMAFIMLAFVGIAEKNLKIYIGAMALAAFIHMPALIFLPAYWLAQQRVNLKIVLIYLLLGIVIFTFKDQFVAFIKSFYYEDDEVFIYSGNLGGRFIMILGFTLMSLLLTGFPSRNYEKLFHLMAVAAILQMLSGFDNIFTRLTDYYFQFSVLYLPMLFYPPEEGRQKSQFRPVVPFNQRSMRLFGGVIVLFLIWFYYTYNVNITIANEVDNYLDFRFMWDVP